MLMQVQKADSDAIYVIPALFGYAVLMPFDAIYVIPALSRAFRSKGVAAFLKVSPPTW